MAQGRPEIKLVDKSFQLAKLDMGKKIRRSSYEEKLEDLQLTLRRIQQAYLVSGRRAVILFEGWDAAGKGGTTRRMAWVLDPRGFKVWPIGAPRQYYEERHYLHRFWERLPPRGGISVFDRSWYGRVLVERVEGFAEEPEWGRAYDEINEFERLLIDDGARVVKLFMHITPEEQLRRFEERVRDPLKRWKLTSEDFRNRDKWALYENAVQDMVQRTSTRQAPWHVVPANDKKYGRIIALRAITSALGKGVDLDPPPLHAEVEKLARDILGDSVVDGVGHGGSGR